MIDPTRLIDITWQGPFAWPGFESEFSLPAIPTVPGVYIQAFEHQGGAAVHGRDVTA